MTNSNQLGRKMNVRNFGLGSRDLYQALINANHNNGDSYATQAAKRSHLKDFRDYLKEQGVKDLRKLTKDHVIGFAKDLKSRCEQGQITPSTAQNKLSAVNSTLERASLSNRFSVLAVKDVGMPKRSGVAKSDKSITAEAHAELIEKKDPLTGALLELQRELGLRFKESSLIDAQKALKQAVKNGEVSILKGTKGGLLRTLPITNEQQIAALREAALIQGKNTSMIPETKNFKQFQREQYDLVPAYHGERHHYANERYQKLAGVKSPVRAGIKHGRTHHRYIAQQLNVSVEQAKEIDHKARMQLARELGHGRIDVTNSYIG